MQKMHEEEPDSKIKQEDGDEHEGKGVEDDEQDTKRRKIA
jgi:hypothetical protein